MSSAKNDCSTVVKVTLVTIGLTQLFHENSDSTQITLLNNKSHSAINKCKFYFNYYTVSNTISYIDMIK